MVTRILTCIASSTKNKFVEDDKRKKSSLKLPRAANCEKVIIWEGSKRRKFKNLSPVKGNYILPLGRKRNETVLTAFAAS